MTDKQLREALGPGEGRAVSQADRLIWLDDDDLYTVDRFAGAALALTGVDPDPREHACTVDGLTGYLRERGIVHFSAPEWTRPRLQKLAASLYPGAPRDAGGDVMFLPGRWAWPRMVVLGWVLEVMRRVGGAPLWIVNAWRPALYNRDVTKSRARPTGTVNSDHVWACGVDVAWPSDAAAKRRAAIDGVIGPLWRLRLLDLSVGLYGRRLHVGVLSPGGRRYWTGEGIDWPFGG